MIDACVKIGLDRCPWCSLPGQNPYYCWIQTTKDVIGPNPSKNKLMDLLSAAMEFDRNATKFRYSVYYMIGTIKHYYPDKADMIDKLMPLL